MMDPVPEEEYSDSDDSLGASYWGDVRIPSVIQNENTNEEYKSDRPDSPTLGMDPGVSIRAEPPPLPSISPPLKDPSQERTPPISPSRSGQQNGSRSSGSTDRSSASKQQVDEASKNIDEYYDLFANEEKKPSSPRSKSYIPRRTPRSPKSNIFPASPQKPTLTSQSSLRISRQTSRGSHLQPPEPKHSPGTPKLGNERLSPKNDHSPTRSPNISPSPRNTALLSPPPFQNPHTNRTSIQNPNTPRLSIPNTIWSPPADRLSATTSRLALSELERERYNHAPLPPLPVSASREEAKKNAFLARVREINKADRTEREKISCDASLSEEVKLERIRALEARSRELFLRIKREVGYDSITNETALLLAHNQTTTTTNPTLPSTTTYQTPSPAPQTQPQPPSEKSSSKKKSLKTYLSQIFRFSLAIPSDPELKSRPSASATLPAARGVPLGMGTLVAAGFVADGKGVGGRSGDKKEEEEERRGLDRRGEKEGESVGDTMRRLRNGRRASAYRRASTAGEGEGEGSVAGTQVTAWPALGREDFGSGR